MKHRHLHGFGHSLFAPEGPRGPGHAHPHHGPHRGGRHSHRPFDYGELRLLLLAMIADKPSHGYELIKAVEDRFGGSYTPSPGVIYPTLSWLEDMGYTTVEASEGNRKCSAITAEGRAFLDANRAAVDAISVRIGQAGPAGREGVPAPVVRAMENLKVALRLRMRRGIDAEAAARIAAALDEAVRTVEAS